MTQHAKFVTRSEKTGHIYTKHTCSYYGTYLLFCILYIKSVSFTEFLMKCCIYDEVFTTILSEDKRRLLHFKVPKLGYV